jgi:hypothetical protein
MNQPKVPFQISLTQDDIVRTVMSDQGGYIQSFDTNTYKTFINIRVPYLDPECFESYVFSSRDIRKGEIRLKETSVDTDAFDGYEHEVILKRHGNGTCSIDPQQENLYVALFDYNYSYCLVWQIAVVNQKYHWFLRTDVVAESVFYMRLKNKRRKASWVQWDRLEQYRSLRKFFTQHTNVLQMGTWVNDTSDIDELRQNAPLYFTPINHHNRKPRSADPDTRFCFVKQWDIVAGEGIVCDIEDDERYTITYKMIRKKSVRPEFLSLQEGTFIEVVFDQNTTKQKIKHVYQYGYIMQETPVQPAKIVSPRKNKSTKK